MRVPIARVLLHIFSNAATVQRIVKATGGKLRTSFDELSRALHRTSIRFDLEKTSQTWLVGRARETALDSARLSTERLLKVLGADPNAALADEELDARLRTILEVAYERILEKRGGREPADDERLQLNGWTVQQVVLQLRILRLVIMDAARESSDAYPPVREKGDLAYRQRLITDRLPNVFATHFEGGSRPKFINAYLVEVGLEPLSADALKKRNRRRRHASEA